MNYHNYREYTLLDNHIPICDPLNGEMVSEHLIIWGGMAGLHSALELTKHWVDPQQIALVEKGICGSGMSGKSGGFLTPDSELGLRALERRYGNMVAKKIREFGSQGQVSITSNVREFGFNCDLRDQDSLLLGLWKSGIQACIEENRVRTEYSLDSELILDIPHLRSHNSGECYSAWTKYTDCYGIDAFQYCQSLKQYLINLWVRIYEFTEIDELLWNKAKSNRGSITFTHAFICPGKVTPSLSTTKGKLLYGVMNYIAVSEPLEDSQIKAMMPWWECMCRDTKLVFTYYRIISWNRVILWWWDPISAFQPREIQYDAAIQKATRDFIALFPMLEWIRFSDYRSWRIQVSKDLMPIIDTCSEHCNHTRVLWCAWLPWAAACWEYAIKKHFGKHDKALEEVFSVHRERLLPVRPSNNIIKSIIFWISNARSMFWQKGY